MLSSQINYRLLFDDRSIRQKLFQLKAINLADDSSGLKDYCRAGSWLESKRRDISNGKIIKIHNFLSVNVEAIHAKSSAAYSINQMVMMHLRSE